MALKTKLHALFVCLESAFGTDPDSDGSDYKFLKCIEATWQPNVDVIQRPGLVKDLTTQEHAIGARTGTLSFKLELKGSGTPANDGIEAIACEADPILQSYFGSVQRQTGDLVQAGSTSTVINVVDGTNFRQYGMVELTYSGKTYRRHIASIATNALTLDRALPGVPSNGSTVKGSSVYLKATDGHQSLSFVGQRDSIEYMFNGCKVDSLKISGVNARGTGILEVSCTASDWSITTKASLPSTVLTGITAVKAPVVKGAPFAYNGTETHIYALEFDPGMKQEFIDSTQGATTFAGADGVNAGIEAVDSDPKGSFKPYFSATIFADAVAGTARSLAFATENLQGANGWGLYIINGQMDQHQDEDHNGMVGTNVPFYARDNGLSSEYSLSVF